MPNVFRAIFGRFSRQSVVTDSVFFRLCYRVTVIILVAWAGLMIVQGIFQEPMKCTFEGYHESNFDRFCSLKSLFSLSQKVTLVEYVSVSDGSAAQVSINFNYYQLGFITLLLQAALLYFPRYVWKVMEGGKMKMLATELMTSTKGTGDNEKNIQPLILYFRKHFHTNDNYADRYIFCELLNLLSIGVQLQFMYIFIGDGYEINHIRAMFTGEPTGDANMTRQLLSMNTECTLSVAGPFDGPENPWIVTGTCPLMQGSVNQAIQAFLFRWLQLLSVYGIFVILYRFATCLCSSLRWFKFRSSCSEFSAETMTVAYNRLNFGDWFALLMLRKNIDKLHYEELIMDLAYDYESDM